MSPELTAGLNQTALGLTRPDRSSNTLLKWTLKGRRWRILEKTSKDSRLDNTATPLWPPTGATVSLLWLMWDNNKDVLPTQRPLSWMMSCHRWVLYVSLKIPSGVIIQIECVHSRFRCSISFPKRVCFRASGIAAGLARSVAALVQTELLSTLIEPRNFNNHSWTPGDGL